MKKVVLMTAMCFLLLGWNECVAQKTKKAFTPAEREVIIQKFWLDYLSTNACDLFIVIDNCKVSQVMNINTWKSNNADYLTSDRNIMAAGCTSEKSYIGLVKFDNKGGDLYKEKLAKWLNENGKYICYEATYKTIECVHRITDKNMQEVISEYSVIDSKSFNELKAMFPSKVAGLDIEKVGTSVQDCTDIYDLNYDYYMNFEVDWKDRIDFTLSKTYKPTSDYYSLPLLRSIMVNNSITDLTSKRFQFRKLSISGKFSQIIISVKLNDDSYAYYNFSQIPPGFEEGYYFKFSPL